MAIINVAKANVVTYAQSVTGQYANDTSFTAILKEDGTVWCSGDNTYGQLGDTNQIIMVLDTGEVQGFGNILNGKIAHLENAVKVQVGNGYLLILNTNGEVFKYENNSLTKVENIQNANEREFYRSTKNSTRKNNYNRRIRHFDDTF